MSRGILGSLTLLFDPTSQIYPHKVFACDTTKAAINSFTWPTSCAMRRSR